MKPISFPFFFSLILACTTFGSACASSGHPHLETVAHVDLARYAGKWNQIAYLPMFFQKNCTIDTTAEYTPREDGTVAVHNECTKANGKRKSIDGTARVVDAATQAQLKVKFFWFAPSGDYWIIDLGPDYEYAVVGTPNRKYLWILSRTKVMGRDLYTTLVERARRQGFPVDEVQITSSVE